MTSATCGSWIGALIWRVIRHGCVLTGRPCGALRLAAGVGAAVEAPAGRALVDRARAERHRLAQAGGVAAGLRDLVGERRAVDAAVGHPAGRRAGPDPAAARRLAGAVAGDLVEQRLQVDLVLELLELAGAGVGDRLLERLGQRSAGRPAPASAASPATSREVASPGPPAPSVVPAADIARDVAALGVRRTRRPHRRRRRARARR